MRKFKSTKKDIITYDEHMLDGIEYLDINSAMSFIKSMIPSDVYARKSPYMSVRKLVKFFDKESGVLRHGRGGSADLVRYLYSHDEIRKQIALLTARDSELITLIYEQKMYNGLELVERVVWKLDAIMEAVQTLTAEISHSQCDVLYGKTEAMKGSPDGRLVGLQDIIINAVQKIDEVTKQAKKLDNLLKKGNDPLSYACPSNVRYK